MVGQFSSHRLYGDSSRSGMGRCSATSTGKAEGLRQFREARGKHCATFSRHCGTKREGHPRNPAIDGVRSVLEAVLRLNMSRTGVVIVTYNSAGMIERCLKSCGDLPVVVVDNASHDATCELVRRHTFGEH